MPNHYLLTGGAGFIGSKVAAQLLEAGHLVTAVDDVNSAYDVRLKEWRLKQLLGRPNLSFHRLDIRDKASLRPLFKNKIDGVINLAARAGVRQSIENPWIYFETNTTGALNLLELCKEFGVGKYVLSSTSSVYGAKNKVPFREDANTNYPISPYAASKKAAEALCYTYHYLYKIDITVLRYFTVYGPSGRPDMSLFRFVQWIAEGRPVLVYGDGRQSRDFTYVDDVARGTIAALRPLGYETINLGSDRPVTVNKAIRLIEARLKKKAVIKREPMHPADVPATWADISKAKRILKWAPQTSIEQGVAALVEWYLENRSWAKEVATG